MFLEAAHFLVAGQFGVRDHDPHDGHRQQPAFMQHGIGRGKDPQQQGKEHGHLHILGHPAAFEGARQADPRSDTSGSGNGGPDKQLQHRLGRRCGGVQGNDDLESQHGGQRADGVVQDRLPLQQGGRAARQPRGAQQRRDHRGAGHDHDPAKDGRAGPAEPRHIMQRQRRHQPAKGRADIDQPAYTADRVLQRVKVQRQTALEQDNRHGDRDHRPHQRPDIPCGIEDAQNRPDQDAGHQHQHDGGHAQPPCDPLRPHPDRADQCDRSYRI